MLQDLDMTEGSIKARRRAIRLVKRVAKAMDERKTTTNEEIIDLCTEMTTGSCIFLNSS